MSLIDEKALDSHIAEIARSTYLEEHAKNSGMSKRELQETIRLMVQQRAFNRKQAAKYIGKSPSTIDRLVKRGELATTTNGTFKYFRKEDLDRWIDSGITTKNVV